MAEFFQHLTIGPCWWDILGTALLIAACAYTVIRRRGLKKELEELKGGKVR